MLCAKSGEIKNKRIKWRLLKDMGGISNGNRRVGKNISKKRAIEGGGSKFKKQSLPKNLKKKGFSEC